MVFHLTPLIAITLKSLKPAGNPTGLRLYIIPIKCVLSILNKTLSKSIDLLYSTKGAGCSHLDCIL